MTWKGMCVLFKEGQFAHHFMRELMIELLNLVNINGENLVYHSGSDRSHQGRSLTLTRRTRVYGLVTSSSFCKNRGGPHLYIKAPELFPYSPEVGVPFADSWYHFRVVESQDERAYDIMVTKSNTIFENFFCNEVVREHATYLIHIVLEKD